MSHNLVRRNITQELRQNCYQYIRKKNLENLHHKLQNTDWGFLDDHLDVNSKFNTFHQHIIESIDNFCPLRERKIKYKNIRREPWLTPGLMISMKKCKR